MSDLQEKIRSAIAETAQDIIDDLDHDTDRDDFIERIDEEQDSLFGRLVKHGRITDYDVDDMVRTSEDCAAIIKVAEADAWVEDDYGLWEGLTYGVLASIAYFSLRNCLYEAMKELGVDSNDDEPLKRYKADEAVKDMPRARIIELLASVDIQCDDEEDDDTLREALAVNLADGTIDLADAK